VTSQRANPPQSASPPQPGAPPQPPAIPSFDEMVDAWVKAATDAERRWNEYFNQVMGTDQFAQTMQRSMETYTAMQANFMRGMEQYLRSLSIPTQSDLAKLAERITMLERRLDELTIAEDDDESAEGEGRSSGGKKKKRDRS
jgi:polyhydroxyalkanoate synthesis regulator phasin